MVKLTRNEWQDMMIMLDGHEVSEFKIIRYIPTFKYEPLNIDAIWVGLEFDNEADETFFRLKFL
jgi:hypothetical protein